MQGRGFLAAGRRLAAAPTEGDWRGAFILAYYALFLESREALRRWGRILPRQANVHHAVRTLFVFAAEKDLKKIGDALDQLGQLRSKASYEENPRPPFTRAKSVSAVQLATDTIALLDALEADASRRAVAIASLPP